MNSTIFICLLSVEKQEKIKELVYKHYKKEGYSEEKIQEIITNVMDDRLWNIEEIIDIKQFLD